MNTLPATTTAAMDTQVPGVVSFRLPFLPPAPGEDQTSFQAIVDAAQHHIDALRFAQFIVEAVARFPAGVEAMSLCARRESESGEEWVDFSAHAYERDATGAWRESEREEDEEKEIQWAMEAQQHAPAGYQGFEDVALRLLADHHPRTPAQWMALAVDEFGPHARASVAAAGLEAGLPGPSPKAPSPRL